MKKYLTVKNIAVFFSVLLAIILVFTLTHKNKTGKIDFAQKYLDLTDSLLAAKEQVIEAKNQANQEKDKSIAQHNRQDSILNQIYLLNQKNYKTIDEKLKNVPVSIARIANNDDSVRAAYRRLGHD